MGGKQGHAAKEYKDPTSDLFSAGQTQLQNNRPNQTNAFGVSTTWDEDGNQNTSFGGPMGGAVKSLQEQYGQNMSQPFSFSQFGQLQDGSSARDQAINAAYGQATSRLDPMWSKREDTMRTRLLNQGLDPSSQAYRDEMSQLGLQRNDAYSSAMNGAIAQGTDAGHTMFGDNMMARQQAIAEALRQRGMPMEDMQKLLGLTGQAGFNADNTTYAAASDAAGLNQASTMDYNRRQDMLNEQDRKMAADAWGGWTDFLGSVAGAAGGMSDERTKQNITRLDFEAIPGVPFATWEWRHAPGVRNFGVIAQDLEKVAPQFVHERDGIKFVDYSFLKER